MGRPFQNEIRILDFIKEDVGTAGMSLGMFFLKYPLMRIRKNTSAEERNRKGKACLEKGWFCMFQRKLRFFERGNSRMVSAMLTGAIDLEKETQKIKLPRGRLEK